MLISFAELLKGARQAALGAAIIAGAAQVQAQTASGPFAGYAGSWSGGGKISLVSGAVERLRCAAGYRVEDDGAALIQDLRCASDTYKFELKNQIEASGSEIAGRWFEATRNAEGAISGRAGAGRIEGTATGPGFTATFSLHERANRQQVVIKAQGGENSRNLGRAGPIPLTPLVQGV